jgi:lipoprotein-releasing system ATP-binding protein
MMPGWILNKNIPKLRERAQYLLEIVGLSQRKDHRPNQLSGGERQRVAMIRALINQPRVVLADEPTGNLDSANAQNLLQMMEHFKKEYQQTFIIVTHNQDLELRFDDTICLKDGLVKKD